MCNTNVLKSRRVTTNYCLLMLQTSNWSNIDRSCILGYTIEVSFIANVIESWSLITFEYCEQTILANCCCTVQHPHFKTQMLSDGMGIQNIIKHQRTSCSVSKEKEKHGNKA